MTIVEMREKKRQAEKDILGIVINFYKETGLVVTGIDLGIRHASQQGNIDIGPYYNIDLSIKV